MKRSRQWVRRFTAAGSDIGVSDQLPYSVKYGTELLLYRGLIIGQWPAAGLTRLLDDRHLVVYCIATVILGTHPKLGFAQDQESCAASDKL